MADDSNLRNRRSYYHRRGDHSLCRADRCPDAAAQAAGGEPQQAGALTVAVREMAGALRFSVGDPRNAVVALLVQLAAAMESAPPSAKAGIAREMRTLLAQILEFPEQRHDEIDVLRARRAAKAVAALLAG